MSLDENIGEGNGLIFFNMIFVAHFMNRHGPTDIPILAWLAGLK